MLADRIRPLLFKAQMCCGGNHFFTSWKSKHTGEKCGVPPYFQKLYIWPVVLKDEPQFALYGTKSLIDKYLLTVFAIFKLLTEKTWFFNDRCLVSFYVNQDRFKFNSSKLLAPWKTISQGDILACHKRESADKIAEMNGLLSTPCQQDPETDTAKWDSAIIYWHRNSKTTLSERITLC